MPDCPHGRSNGMLEKECSSCQLLCKLSPYLLALGALRWVSTSRNKLQPRYIRQVITHRDTQTLPGQPLLLTGCPVPQAAGECLKEHHQILLESLRRNGVLNFPLSPLCSWGMEHGNRALPKVMQEMLWE